MRALALVVSTTLLAFSAGLASAAEAAISSINIVSNKYQVKITPDADADVLRILTRTNLASPWTTNSATTDAGTNSPLIGYTWSTNIPSANSLFLRAELQSISSQRQLAAHVLNRLAYGPTPYDMGRILGYVTNFNGPNYVVEFGEGIPDGGIGVDAWIAEQLNPNAINEDVTNQFASIAPIYNRFGAIDTVVLTNQAGSGETNQPGTLSFHDLRAWISLHAVGGRRQLMEVLLNWFENHHFVSQWTKARETFQGSFNGVGGDIQNRIPTKMEAEEHKMFRAAFLRNNITFRELLRLQHESTSMTVYLDTNDSVGNGNNVANENYGREIMELYAMGVDNGYDQGDITAISLAWTGWDVRKVAPSNAFNLYAHQQGALAGAISNNYGVFVLQFRPSVHGNSNLFLWYNRNSVGAMGNNYPNGQIVSGSAGPKTVPSRFNGTSMTPSYNYANKTYGTNTVAGRYSLFIPTTTTDAQRTNKVYTIMDHMADLPFTQEFMSVRLCQLFVHDDFALGYNFSDGVVTPEEQLVWNCMLAWETNNPKGQIYKVIKTITDSSLFRSQASYRQKIKNPFEYAMSTVRALRVATNDVFNAGNFTAETDGYSIVSGNSSTATAHPLNRMGRYLLNDREEPDGYPETGTVYVGANGLAERVRWINSVMASPTIGDGIAGGNNTRFDVQGVLNRFLSPNLQKDQDAVARLFIRLLYPGEGGVNTDEYRRQFISFLNTSDSGTVSAFNLLTVGSTTYDTRIRRAVGMLMSMQRFNEQ